MDWKKIITELLAAGLTETIIAAHCGTTQSTINLLKSGKSKTTMYEVGDKLVSLWKVKVQS